MITWTCLSICALLPAPALASGDDPATSGEANPVKRVRESQMDFHSGGDTRASRLLVPDSKTPLPTLVILLDGSDERPSATTLDSLTDAYLGAGVAVLQIEILVDDNASFNERTAEVLTGLRNLRTQPGLEPTRVGLWSLGRTAAWIASRVASEDPDLAFLILVSAPMESLEVHRLRRQTPLSHRGARQGHHRPDLRRSRPLPGRSRSTPGIRRVPG